MLRVKHSRFSLLSLNSYSVTRFASEVLCGLKLSTLEWLNKLAQFIQVRIKQQTSLRFHCTVHSAAHFPESSCSCILKVLISSMQWQHFLSLWYRQDFKLHLGICIFTSSVSLRDVHHWLPTMSVLFVGCNKITHSIVYFFVLSYITQPSNQATCSARMAAVSTWQMR